MPGGAALPAGEEGEVERLRGFLVLGLRDIRKPLLKIGQIWSSFVKQKIAVSSKVVKFNHLLSVL